MLPHLELTEELAAEIRAHMDAFERALRSQTCRTALQQRKANSQLAAGAVGSLSPGGTAAGSPEPSPAPSGAPSSGMGYKVAGKGSGGAAAAARRAAAAAGGAAGEVAAAVKADAAAATPARYGSCWFSLLANSTACRHPAYSSHSAHLALSPVYSVYSSHSAHLALSPVPARSSSHADATLLACLHLLLPAALRPRPRRQPPLRQLPRPSPPPPPRRRPLLPRSAPRCHRLGPKHVRLPARPLAPNNPTRSPRRKTTSRTAGTPLLLRWRGASAVCARSCRRCARDQLARPWASKLAASAVASRCVLVVNLAASTASACRP
jgi:hypothetical protein